jgi:hypothetical protein
LLSFIYIGEDIDWATVLQSRRLIPPIVFKSAVFSALWCFRVHHFC